ncbi:hypothetical protein GF362_06395 [Candidatus Dojkabacteria bacterium]|nr:hypothetical protein [Candidatus Dojkabacteria bacterium]
MYSRNIGQGPKLRKFWQILIVVFITISIPLGLIALKLSLDMKSDAGPTEEPQELVISNITDTSFVISFLTPSMETKATVNYGEQGEDLNSSSFDERSEDGTESFHLHYHKITNLKPDTDYTFQVVVGSETYESADYTIKTMPISSSLPTPSPINGKVVGGTYEEGVVYAHLSDGTQNSTVVSDFLPSSGAYALDISNAKTKAGEDFPADAQIVVFASVPTQGKGYVTNDADEQFMEDITLDENATSYNPESLEYIGEESETTETPTQTPEATPEPTTAPTAIPTTVPTPIPTTPETTSEQVKVSNLSNFENIIPGAVIMGTGEPNSVLTIKLRGVNIGTTVVSPQKTWQFQLPTEISPGNAELSIESDDQVLTMNIVIEDLEDLPVTAISDYTSFFPGIIIFFLGLYLIMWIQTNHKWGRGIYKDRSTIAILQ